MLNENDLYKNIIEKQDAESLEILYDRYESLLFNLAYKITNDKQFSEEVLQDVFMKIWNQKAIYNSKKGKLSTWLITLCRNKSIDILRKRKNIEVQFEDEYQGIIMNSSPEYGLLDKECSKKIQTMIASLNQKQQAIIALFYYKGLSQKEIAIHLKIPLGTVKSRLRLAIQHLNSYIKNNSRRESEEDEK